MARPAPQDLGGGMLRRGRAQPAPGPMPRPARSNPPLLSGLRKARALGPMLPALRAARKAAGWDLVTGISRLPSGPLRPRRARPLARPLRAMAPIPCPNINKQCRHCRKERDARTLEIGLTHG